MKMQDGHLIREVVQGSIAEELEIESGDYLVEINKQKIKDVFDYHFLCNDEYIEVLIRKQDGEEWLLEIEKEYQEELGILFQSDLMDEYTSCNNRCIFCFIDQMPKGMRETLYFKDDDSRLSFLQGNYITLTNMKDEDIDRIILYKLSPINISIHTTNKELRCTMLHNRFAGEKLDYIKRLYEAEIEMNGQIVLCKGVNDKEELENSIGDLAAYIPYLRSVSVVPVGITKYREGLYELESFTKEDAQEVVHTIHKWQEKIYHEHGIHFIHAGDEWYIQGEMQIPRADNYDGFLQIENGVGMVRNLLDEFYEALDKIHVEQEQIVTRTISVVTGVSSFGYINQMMNDIMKQYTGIKIHVYKIINNFFGNKITVTGLLTGDDIIKQLKGKELGETLLMPNNLLRSGEDVLLDDLRVCDIEKELNIQIAIVKNNGMDLVKSVLEGVL